MMQGSQEQMNLTDPPSEDDMVEGDLGDGMSARSVKLLSNTHRSRLRSKDSVGDVPPQMRPSKRGSEGSSASFSWTPCSAMYSAFRNELEADGVSQWRRRYSDSSAGESNEVLQRRLQEITEEVELLRTELEVTHRHLEGKHEALRILQGQAILDKATCHTKILLQKSEERTKALEKEVNALQWEITFNQVQFNNVEHEWKLKYERVSSENKLLSKTLDERLQQLQELHRENSSLSQQSLELLGLLKAQERRDFQRTQPPASRGTEGSALELAVYGACQCSIAGGEPPCPCAKSAAASRRQVLHLKQELELQRRRKDEAYVMMDAFRIAFEQQLRRGSEKVLKLTESDGVVLQDSPLERGTSGTGGVTQKLRRFLPSVRDGKGLNNPKDTLQRLLDLLSDKEEALAHQRKVSYMLAQSTEELQRRLQEQLTEPTMILTRGKSKPHACKEVEFKSDDCSVNCKPAVKEDELTSAELQPETETEGQV